MTEEITETIDVCANEESFQLPSSLTSSLGGTIWPSAAAAALLLYRWRGALAQKNVLELGAGLGLGGLVAAKVGAARVVLTDCDDAVLEQQLCETALSVPNCTALKLDWRNDANSEVDWRNDANREFDWRNDANSEIDDASEEVYDVVVGADVAYFSKVVPDLYKTIKSRLAPKGLAIIVGETQRDAQWDLFEAMRGDGTTTMLEFDLDIDCVLHPEKGAPAPPAPPQTSVSIAVIVHGCAAS
eukprot:CAMPEP_0184112462 /NCGR_PEP_ID=MMETSP0974-20121125/18422_1 /TAXON_ID=483370 /ORGANISM="non described non described, Strain CCMP2097" /LENGTH=242 /DNA_ID=CAMNT_0026415545 /DNA_START=15 /DNA_END=740 /DNA_ORIENTATION=-